MENKLNKNHNAEDNLKFSMIVSSNNRSKFLGTFFSQLHIKDLIENNVQIILVNNASTDNTEKVIKSFIEKNPELNCIIVNERKKGLGNARNGVLNALTGDVILFSDDIS